MIIQAMASVRSAAIGRMAWAGLHRFENVAYVTELIKLLHEVPKKHFNDAKKQATQIRQCIIQAHEYHRAADVVSLATKPLLLYYSLMSLALAQVLLKGSGDMSLDAARASHSHHGLTFSFAGKRSDLILADAAAALRARPLGGGNSGTFQLWHKGARETPIGGEIRTVQGVTTHTAFAAMLYGADKELDAVPAGGLTLLDCISSLPSLRSFGGQHGVPSNCVRAWLKIDRFVDQKRSETRITLQPSFQGMLQEVLNKTKFSCAAQIQMEYQELSASSGLITLTEKEGHPLGHYSLPNGTQLNTSDVWFFTKNDCLNEFGLFYVSLFMLGSFARYYPDKWMVEVDRASPLALAADALIASAEDRVPLLALSEMARVFTVPET